MLALSPLFVKVGSKGRGPMANAFVSIVEGVAQMSIKKKPLSF